MGSPISWPLSRSASVNGKSFTTSYSYDSYNAKGKLTQERNITPVGTQIRSWSFDTLSRLYSSKVDITTSHPGSSQPVARAFEAFTTYDSYSRVEKIVYPQNGSATNFLKYVYENGYFKSAMYNATTVWNTTARASDQQVKTATLGGGLTINRTYDNLGRIASINTVTAAAPVTTLQNATFTFDALGSLTARTDSAAGAGVNDTFCYDKLNRLVGTCSATACSQSTFYDAYGNLTAKPGMASYGYGTIGTNNRLTSANGVTLTYDAGGNITGDGTRTFSYTPYDVPDKITQGALWSEWGFTGNGQRAFERCGSNATANAITYQAGPGFFEQDESISVNTSAVTEVREFLTTPVGTIGVVITRNGVATTNYYLQDHLGSNVASVSSTGTIVARSKFDPWGLRTVTAGIVDNGDRGFTGHEHLDFGLIHMNGRIYDPKWGRFLQADPIIQSPYDLQNYNRYSYVMNNPVSMTDPSGYSARSFNRFMTRFTALHGDFAHSYIDRRWGMRAYNDPYVRTAAALVAAYFTYGAASSYFTGAAMAGGSSTTFATVAVSSEAGGVIGASLTGAGTAVASAAAGFAAGGIQGGNLNSALSGAVSGAISGGISGYFGSSYPVERIAANAVAGGVSSSIRGGKFSEGLKFALSTSLLAYANVQMRNEMIEQSKLDARNDGTGLSRGMFGDLFKLAGGRWNPFEKDGVVQCSPLGCLQSGPGSVASMGYSKGGFIDLVTEAFAGPHDKANSRWFYDSNGLIKDLTGTNVFALDMATNYTTSLIFATPFALGAIAEQLNYSSYRRIR
jgi:RHS repeat-associated protein